jgi:urea transport system permease protein
MMGAVEQSMHDRGAAAPLPAPRAAATALPISPPARMLFTRVGWGTFAVVALIVLVLLPLANLAVPAGHPLHVSDFLVTLVG